jgi:septal ring factor EnvC (AmiA/AmiB activator)
MKLTITIFFTIVLSLGGFAQQRQQARPQQQTRQPSKEQLQEQAKRLETQLRNNNRLLEETTKNRTANVTQVNILNTQIGQRDQLIRTINSEISVVNRDISNLEKEITSLEREIKNLKDEYARIIVATHRHMNPSEQLMFIVASESFNQAYRRIRYFQQYSAHRKKQVELIRQKQDELAEMKLALEQEKDTKSQLLNKEQQERKSLDSDRTKRNRAISDLQRRERQLREDIRKNQAEQKRLSQQIERIIQQEVEAARKAAAQRAAEEAKRRGETVQPARPDVTQLTPAEQKLADDFVSNRGRLPWPTERGVITERFGTHDHPVIKGVKISNDGVSISTSPNEPVRAVFEGVVTNVFSTPTGNGTSLIIVHGNYRTVYVNLKSVSVKAGQRVTTRQQIGQVNTHNDNTVLQFQLWRDLQKLNPEQWISSR